VTIDDQSLWARVTFLSTTKKVAFHDLGSRPEHEKVWTPPLEIPEHAVNIITALLLIGLGAITLAVWVRADGLEHSEGLLYMLVLLSLLPVPHMERYNHVLLLPAMAWLWAKGGRYRYLTVLAYCLAGLSRLNHLWARLLGWPLGPIATGACTWAILIMVAGIAYFVLCWRRAAGAD